MADSGSSLAAAIDRFLVATPMRKEGQEIPYVSILGPTVDAVETVLAAARERLRLSRDENGEWPAELRAFVASELSYPRVATDAHERKAIAMLDALDVYAKATT